MAYGERAIKKPFLSSTGSSREGQEDLMITQEVGSLKKERTYANVNRVQT